MPISEILMILFTAVIAVSTVFYTIYSHKLWKETYSNTLISKFTLLMNYINMVDEKIKDIKDENEKKFLEEYKLLFTELSMKTLFKEVSLKNSSEYNNFIKKIFLILTKYNIKQEEISLIYNKIFNIK